MSELPTLIKDLALILIFAGVFTLLFKKLKQPLVLGYIVAGFIASPHLRLTPSVLDAANIQTWADIGVIFLLFALGLEFSFKKLMKVGGPAVIAAVTIIMGMVTLGFLLGTAMGWKEMDCLFLGGMLAMSSTSIIYKAFNDLGMQTRKFAGLVFGILVIEDVVAVVLMVLLSTMAVSHSVEGTELLFSILKLAFFLLLWFVTGIYLIPPFFRYTKKLMGDETMLIVSLALCLGMVVFASRLGFSSALGAFVMGSILAETIEAERIERLVQPVKDLFGAIFFVSVGMMVDPALIGTYIFPILLITLAVLAGQLFFGTLGVLLSGQPLKEALQCGFSLTQIGEFAFIIAGLGISLKVTSDFLYPVVVAVAVITTFLTPYMIRLAEPAYPYIEKRIPVRWRNFLNRYASGLQTLNHESNWKKLITALLRILLIYSVITIAIIVLSLNFLAPLLTSAIPGFWGSFLSALITILAIAPFLRAMIVKKNHSEEFQQLWQDSRFNRGHLVSIIILRVVLAVSYVMFVIGALFKASAGLIIGIAVLLVFGMIFSRWLKRQSILIERRFLKNFRAREAQEEKQGKRPPRFAAGLLSKDIHLATLGVPADSLWAGKTLAELSLNTRFGIHVVGLYRGSRYIEIPGGKECIYPGDRLQVIGSDQQIAFFDNNLRNALFREETTNNSEHEMTLGQFTVDEASVLKGKSIRESGIREQFHCMVVGVERGERSVNNPKADVVFESGDLVWVVGEKEAIHKLAIS